MKLKEIGEFGFIDRFRPLFENLVHPGQTGIGDDCAIIPAGNGDDWLVTTDLLIEDVHFLRNAITPGQLGYKSLAVNLSDIASMGGTPVGSFLSIAVPPDVEVEYLDALMEGYHKLSAKYDTPLLGGDTTKSLKHLVINVCVFGKCLRGKARKRSMAQPGDAVCVTGYLGDSAGGLQVLLNKLPQTGEHDYLILKHHLPEPRLREGLFLAKNPAVHAMIDLSDGIASDLRHIVNASGVAATIYLNMLPVSDTLVNVAGKQGLNVTQLATTGGEDYELLFTVAEDEIEALTNTYKATFGKPIFKIGTITRGNPEIRWFADGKEVSLTKSGFDHFL